MKKKITNHIIQRLIAGGIVLSSATLFGSLFYYYNSFNAAGETNAAYQLTGTAKAGSGPDSDFSAAGNYSYDTNADPDSAVADSDSEEDMSNIPTMEAIPETTSEFIAETTAETEAENESNSTSLLESVPDIQSSPEDEANDSVFQNSGSVPFVVSTQTLGNVSDIITTEDYAADTSLYVAMLDTEIGPMIYYNQGDKRWRDYLYGGSDPMKKYGCGPTAVAMIISSFSPQGYNITPVNMADWAAANGGYAPQGGSYHSMIPKSLTAYGLHVEGVELYSEKTAADYLRSGHILVALMGEGALTKNGHFIIITKILDNGNVYIADPGKFGNCTKEWNLAQLMNELKGSYNSGGPLWAVRY